MKIGELIYDLRFNADTTKLSEFLKMIGDLDMSSILAGSGLAGLYAMTSKFLNSTKDLALDMRTFENVTGESAQKMMSWSYAAEQAGVKTGLLEASVKGLQSSIISTKMGNVDMGLIQAYNLLNNYGKANIDINDDIFSQFEKIRKALPNMSHEAQRAVLQLMNMDETMMNLFKASDDVWNKRNDRHNVINPEDIQRMVEMNAEWKSLGQELGIIGNKFATEISPAIIGITRTLIELLKEIKNSWIGGILSKSAEGWGRIGQLAQYTLDNGTDNIAKLSNNIFKETPGWDVPMSGAVSGRQNVSVVSNQYINGDDISAMKQAAKEAQKEAIVEAFHASQKAGY